MVVTTHAIARYFERVERCSVDDARDRLMHAMAISVSATRDQLGCKPIKPGHIYRWCEVEQLMLVCRNSGGSLLLLTVFRIPCGLAARKHIKQRKRKAKVRT